MILHQHFKTPESGGAIRSYYLSRALVDSGIETIVITAHNERKYKMVDVEGIQVHYLPIAYDNSYGFIKRAQAFLQFARKSAARASKFKDADLCYAISVPLTVGLAAMRIKRRYGIPFIFEVGDLWPDAPIELGFIRNYFFKSFLFSLEKRIYKLASAVVALSPSIQSKVEAKVHGVKVHLIPNMSDTEFYIPEEKNQTLVEKFDVKGKLVISYIGAIGVANGLDYMLDCAKSSIDKKLDARFIICGEGAHKERLQKRAKGLRLDNLSFVDFQNRNGIREIMNITDATFICYQNSPILETGSPNKFFDGLAAGKMIIINFGGWIKNEIRENDCGIFVEPTDPSDFVTKISSLVMDREKIIEYQRNSRKLAEAKYSRAQLSRSFVALVKGR